MTIPDIINGVYEGAAALFVANNCRVLYRHKEVRGFSLLSTAFFSSWSVWNLYFYPYVGAMMSFAGAVAMAVANVTYVAMAAYYTNFWARAKEWLGAIVKTWTWLEKL